MKNTNKAFTLVELIVVITILTILGTIAFISLQGYSADAKDGKKVSDLSSLIKKINIEETKGTKLSNLISGSTPITLTINTNTGATANKGTVNFATIKEDADSFKPDKINDYVFSYAKGGSGTGAYNFIQMAATKESDNTAIVVGNYYKMDTNDSASIISKSGSLDLTTTPADAVVNKGSVLPY